MTFSDVLELNKTKETN